MHYHESTKIQQSQPLLDRQHETADSQLLYRDRDQAILSKQKPVAEQKLIAALSNVAGPVKHGELPLQKMSQSLQLMRSDVLHASKQPQSFPDRLAMIQKQKQIEESKSFARSSVRALKVSNKTIEMSM